MYEELKLDLVGVAPLLMHAGRLADPLDAHATAIARIVSKRMKTSADYERIAELEWNGGLWLTDGRPSVPSEAIEACLVTAAKARRAGPKIKAGVTIDVSPKLIFDGDKQVPDLFKDKRFVFRCGVRINNKTVIRTRPRFDSWSINVSVSFLPTMIDRSALTDIVCYAGEMVGLGDYRPKFGRFRVQVR